MGRLSKYVSENNKWVSLGDGESFTGTYKGYEMQMDKVKSVEVPCYKFEDEYGSEKMLNTASKVLAKFFDEDDGKAQLGATVKITRRGKGSETRYEVELIKQGTGGRPKFYDDNEAF